MHESEMKHYDGSTISSGTYTGNLAATKQPAVHDEYGSLKKEIAVLGESIDRLRARLTSVTGPEIPYPEPAAYKLASSDANVPSMSPLADSIRSDAFQLCSLNMQLDNLIHRIEV